MKIDEIMRLAITTLGVLTLSLIAILTFPMVGLSVKIPSILLLSSAIITVLLLLIAVWVEN